MAAPLTRALRFVFAIAAMSHYYRAAAPNMQSPPHALAANSALLRELQQAGMVLIPGGEFSMGASTDDLAGLSANAGDVNPKGTQAEAAKALTWLSSHASPNIRSGWRRLL